MTLLFLSASLAYSCLDGPLYLSVGCRHSLHCPHFAPGLAVAGIAPTEAAQAAAGAFASQYHGPAMWLLP